MRTMAIVTVTVFVSSLLVLIFLQDDGVLTQHHSVFAPGLERTDTATLDSLDKLTNELHRYQMMNQAQIQQTQVEQARTKETLAALTDRLGSMEATLNTSRKHTIESNNFEERSANDEVEENDENNSRGKFSEADLGNWIDNTLLVDSIDATLTAQATEQAATSLGKMPEINLENMQCNDRLCRATFTNSNGKKTDIQHIFGEPPFLTEGFTVNEADGRVSLYFTQPGVSMSELREEAQNF